MHIDHLSLTNFRNYGRLDIEFPAGPTLLYGNNAQGKTNLLEAIFYLATTRSPHADHDQQLLNWQALQTGDPQVVGRLVARVKTAAEERLLELRLIREEKRGQPTFRREALVNHRKVRLMDLLGNLRAVMFLPQDIEMITGSPSQRRRYLDVTLCQIDPIYCRTLSNYNKVLEQRNALLRQLAEGEGSLDLLAVYDDKIVAAGSEVLARRARFTDLIGREAQRIHYEELTDRAESMRLHYLPRLEDKDSRRTERVMELAQLGEWLQAEQQETSIIAHRLQQAVAEVQKKDIARGTSSIGPHRDDWRIWVNGRDLGYYGSRGQQRSAILALKMAEIKWMTQMAGEAPILLLDEVVAELDENRRALLLHYVKHATQALLTATDPGMFTADFLRRATAMRVDNGQISVAASELSL